MSPLPMIFVTSVGDQKPNVKNQHRSISMSAPENLEFNLNYSCTNWLYIRKRIVKFVVNKRTMLSNWQGIKRPLMELFLKMSIFVICARCFSNIQEI